MIPESTLHPTLVHLHLHAIEDSNSDSAKPLEFSRLAPFPISFESLVGKLEQIPRLFIELDGSFVWSGQRDDRIRWQVDGMIYDHLDRVQRVEWKGSCPVECWDRFLECLNLPPTQIAVHLVEQQMIVTAAQIREDFYTCNLIRNDTQAIEQEPT